MYKLYSMQRSGNSYKVRLALALLNAPYRAIEVDILRGESRTPDFLAKNPSGQVPLLEVADGRYLAESNAILWYVAGGTPLAPESRVERAEALQWMFFEQHALEPNIGAAYFWLALVKGGRDLQTHALEDWMERGYAALQVMENHLKTHEYFAAGQLTVADIAMYGYTHVADRCDFDLATFPAIRTWLRRVEQASGFVPISVRRPQPKTMRCGAKKSYDVSIQDPSLRSTVFQTVRPRMNGLKNRSTISNWTADRRSRPHLPAIRCG